MEIPARERCPAAAVRSRSAAPVAQLPLAGTDGAQLGADAIRLGQVVSDGLLAGARPRVQPAREPLVQLRAALLGEPLVRGLADERVREPERVLTRQVRPVRPDQLLADERDEFGCRTPRSSSGRSASTAPA